MTSLCVYVHMMDVCVYVCPHAQVGMQGCVYLCVCVCVCTHTRLCIPIFMHMVESSMQRRCPLPTQVRKVFLASRE